MKNNDVYRIRSFNRFYTNHLGLINQYIYHSHYSLAEVRILYELYHHKGLTAKEITNLLSMDKGLLSRMLRTFEKRGLIKKQTSADDARATNLSLTLAGRKEYEILDKEANEQIENILTSIPPANRRKLIDSMNTIKKILTT